MTETLDLTRTSKPAPDHDIEAAADDIMSILMDFASPKDAGSALALAHFKMVVASFPPEFRADAIASVQGAADCVIGMLNDGWQ